MEKQETQEAVDVSAQVKSLVEKAASTEKSEDAQRFAQAACNAANAMACLHNIRKTA